MVSWIIDLASFKLENGLIKLWKKDGYDRTVYHSQH